MDVNSLKAMRSGLNLTQEQVASKSGISRQYYNYIENGIRIPPVKTAKKIASTLGFNWTLFFEDTLKN